MASPSLTGLSANNPLRYLGPNITIVPIVTRNREPTGADIKQPNTGRYYGFGTLWIVGEDPTTGSYGDLWYLSNIQANVAYWLQLSSGGFGNLQEIQVDAVTSPGVNPVTPILGQIDFNGLAVANHSVPVETRSRALNAMNVEVQYSAASASTDATKTGLAAFNSAQFSVDSNGFVSLVGGSTPSLMGLTPESSTPPGTSPVVPTSGNITIRGGSTFATNTQANPIKTASIAANTMDMQIQLAGSNASTAAANKFGVAQFDQNFFSVTSGYASMSSSFYSTGTFTPVLSFGGSSTGITYANRSGTYTKIGNLVFLNIGMALTSKGSATGNAIISGLPFTMTGDNIDLSLNMNNSNISATTYSTIGVLFNGDAFITLSFFETGSPSPQQSLTNSNINNITSVRVYGFFYV